MSMDPMMYSIQTHYSSSSRAAVDHVTVPILSDVADDPRLASFYWTGRRSWTKLDEHTLLSSR